MNENTANKKSFLNQLTDIIRSNYKIIIIILSSIFIFFLIFQLYSFYSANKIKQNSISFFKVQELDDLSLVNETIVNLSNENNFYGILSQLELIKIYSENKDTKKVIDLYLGLLNNQNLDDIYKSAIASKASYQFINLNFSDLSEDYSEVIKNFISFVDEEIENYKGIRLELNYLTKILDVQKNNIDYLDYKDAIDLYNIIINSEYASSVIKERIKKIHEFFTHK